MEGAHRHTSSLVTRVNIVPERNERVSRRHEQPSDKDQPKPRQGSAETTENSVGLLGSA